MAIKFKKIIIVVGFLLVTIIYSTKVFAAAGGSTGGGGVAGCGDNAAFCTSYGATWRYYPTDSDDVKIDGASATNNDRAYVKEGKIEDCKASGGYWRYAMVASRDGSGASGYNYKKGEQFGLIGIAGNNSKTFDYEFFGGGMKYIPKSVDPRNADWDDVKSLFNTLKAFYPNDSIRNFSFDGNSNLAWFCGPKNTLFSESLVSVHGGSGEQLDYDTGILTENKNEHQTVQGYKVGDEITLSFTHKLYASIAVNSADFVINEGSNEIENAEVISGETIRTNDGKKIEGKVNITTNGNFKVGNQNMTLYKSDAYNVEYKIRLKGSISVCETLNGNELNAKAPTSTLCVDIIVDEKSPNFFAESKVRIGNNNEQTTGIVDNGAASVSLNNVGLNKEVEVVFEHNAYSDSIANDIYWVLDRNVLKDSNSVSVSMSRKCPDSNTGTINFTNNVIGDKIKSDNLNCSNNLTNDVYKVKFSVPNESVKICQTLSVGGKEKTTVCADISAGNPRVAEYYAISNVSVKYPSEKSDYKTTGMRKDNKIVTDYAYEVPVGSTVSVVFSHNVYADVISNGYWKLETKKDVVGGNPSIEEKITCGGNSGGVVFSEIGGGDNPYNYFIGDPSDGSSRTCTDGKYYYIARHIYDIEIKNKDDHIKICQTINVGGSNMSPKTTVCAEITAKDGGVIIPDKCFEFDTPLSYTNSNDKYGVSSTLSAVQNSTLGGSFVKSNSGDVWAKPGDTITWRHCYYPGVQKVANTDATSSHAFHSSYVLGLTNSNTNVSMSSFGLWTNFWKVVPTNLSTNNSFDSGSLPIGNWDIREWEDTYTVETENRSRAGLSLVETSKSGSPSEAKVESGVGHNWSCNAYDCSYTSTDAEGNTITVPKTCYETCSHDNPYIASSRSGTASDSATVKVPYNFTNTAVVGDINSVVDGKKVVYAGESVEVGDSIVYIGVRGNKITGGGEDAYYATKVDDATVRLIAYTSKNDSGESKTINSSDSLCGAIGDRIYCNDEMNTYNGSLNYPEKTAGNEKVLFNGTYNVFDDDAGNYYCMRVAVYPYTTDGDTQMTSGGVGWYISAPKCAIIAKKPSFQVRGGSVYADNISTSTAIKNNLKDNSAWPYMVTGNSGIVFGSWAEQSVIASGIVKGFASGAATNDRSGSDEKDKVNYCNYRVPLSFANFADAGLSICPHSQQVGQSGISVNTNRSELAAYWTVAQDGRTLDNDVASLTVSDMNGDDYRANNLSGNTILYAYKGGNLTLTGGTIGMNSISSTRVVNVSGNVTISGDLKYSDTETYTNISMAPKLVIHASNIYINCSVGRVDAILIAEVEVNTCADSSGNTPAENAEIRGNKQLIINGAILAEDVKLNRAYGAATGNYSGIPAEIINYDVSSILWGGDMASDNKYESMTTVYQQELAPRY